MDIDTPKRFTQVLPVKLTQNELVARGRALTERLAALDEKRAEAADSAKRFKDQITVIDDHCRTLRRTIESESEDRDVECEERIDRVRRIATVVRLDTGEVVSERKLELDDVQAGLFAEDSVVAFEGKKARGR